MDVCEHSHSWICMRNPPRRPDNIGFAPGPSKEGLEYLNCLAAPGTSGIHEHGLYVEDGQALEAHILTTFSRHPSTWAHTTSCCRRSADRQRTSKKEKRENASTRLQTGPRAVGLPWTWLQSCVVFVASPSTGPFRSLGLCLTWQPQLATV